MIISEELFLLLLSVPYLDQEEINLCKKLIYSYSTRLAFHVLGSYLLTIFNHSTVVPASESYLPSSLKILRVKHQPVTFKGEK